MVIIITKPDTRESKYRDSKYRAVELCHPRAVLLAFLVIQVLYACFIMYGINYSHEMDCHNRPSNSDNTAERTAELQEWSEDRTLSAHFENLQVLKYEDRFALITDENQRLQIFADVCDVELNYLSVPYVIEVKAVDLADKTMACYSSDNKIIYVDSDYLRNATAEEIITTAAHECRHSWQHCIVELGDELDALDNTVSQASLILLSDFLADADEYRECFLHYQSDGQGYFEQAVEKDAREYAEEGYFDFINRISQLEYEKGLPAPMQ